MEDKNKIIDYSQQLPIDIEREGLDIQVFKRGKVGRKTKEEKRAERALIPSKQEQKEYKTVLDVFKMIRSHHKNNDDLDVFSQHVFGEQFEAKKQTMYRNNIDIVDFLKAVNNPEIISPTDANILLAQMSIYNGKNTDSYYPLINPVTYRYDNSNDDAEKFKQEYRNDFDIDSFGDVFKLNKDDLAYSFAGRKFYLMPDVHTFDFAKFFKTKRDNSMFVFKIKHPEIDLTYAIKMNNEENSNTTYTLNNPYCRLPDVEYVFNTEYNKLYKDIYIFDHNDELQFDPRVTQFGFDE